VIFLVATDQFRKQEFERRFHSNSFIVKALDGYSNPKDIVMSGFVEAVRLLSDFVHNECEKRDLPLLVTGGRITTFETYETVCHHFAL
jgi:hypothetical protein